MRPLPHTFFYIGKGVSHQTLSLSPSTSMQGQTLLVSRNGWTTNDPTYCSIAHKNVPGEYTMVRLNQNGETVDRSHTTSRSEVEKEMKSFKARSSWTTATTATSCRSPCQTTPSRTT